MENAEQSSAIKASSRAEKEQENPRPKLEQWDLRITFSIPYRLMDEEKSIQFIQ